MSAGDERVGGVGGEQSRKAETIPLLGDEHDDEFSFPFRSESTHIVHWLIGQGLSLCVLHPSIRRGKNDFITSEQKDGDPSSL